MKNIYAGNCVSIHHKFEKKGYTIIGIVATIFNEGDYPFIELTGPGKTKRVYLQNIIAINNHDIKELK